MDEERLDDIDKADEPFDENDGGEPGETETADEEKAQDTETKETDPDNVTAKEDGEAGDTRDKLIAELKDKHLRLFAEFDNFRKRSENEKKAMFDEGEKAVLLRILPLIDNFERALSQIPDDEKESPFAEGIEMTYKAFTEQLKELGVTPIEAVGQPFNADYHNAVMHVEDEDLGTNIVTEEFQKGYMFKDKVLRYSMVKVAN